LRKSDQMIISSPEMGNYPELVSCQRPGSWVDA
jgi:hypothetical protein